MFQKEYIVLEDGDRFNITFSEEDTRFYEPINKATSFWYEIEYNGNQTVIGHDDNGGKELILMPEASQKESE